MLLLLAACAPEYATVAREKRLEGYTWLDAGAVPPDDRGVSVAPLFSMGSAGVEILAMEVEGAGFRVDDPTGATLEAYDPDDDGDTLALDVVFAPTALGEARAELRVWSDDNVSVERAPLPDGSGEAAVWTTPLRGLGRPVCARRWPALVDFGAGDGGAELTSTVHVENCGLATLLVTAGNVTGAQNVVVRDVLPLHILPGEQADLTLAWTVAGALDAVMTLVVDDDALGAAPIVLLGNQPGSEPDADGDGYSERAGDCDDADAAVHPGLDEVYDGRDDDCDGVIDEGTQAVDDDGDGLRELEDDPARNDCDDVDPWVYPGAREDCDGIDNNCDGAVDEDACPPPPGTVDTGGGEGCATVHAVSWGVILAGLLLSAGRRVRTRGP